MNSFWVKNQFRSRTPATFAIYFFDLKKETAVEIINRNLEKAYSERLIYIKEGKILKKKLQL